MNPFRELPRNAASPGDVDHDADLGEGNEGRVLKEAGDEDGIWVLDDGEAFSEGRKHVAAPQNSPGEVEADAGGNLAEKESWETQPCLILL